jgi:hypothetical protein
VGIVKPKIAADLIAPPNSAALGQLRTRHALIVTLGPRSRSRTRDERAKRIDGLLISVFGVADALGDPLLLNLMVAVTLLIMVIGCIMVVG